MTILQAQLQLLKSKVQVSFFQHFHATDEEQGKKHCSSHFINTDSFFVINAIISRLEPHAVDTCSISEQIWDTNEDKCKCMMHAAWPRYHADKLKRRLVVKNSPSSF